MRLLATACFAFALGVLAAQYVLPQQLWLIAAAVCLLAGLLTALFLRGNARRRALLIALGLTAALAWNSACERWIRAPFEAMAGETLTLTMEAADYPVETSYGCRIEVRIPDRALHGRAIYYGSAELLGVEPGTRMTATVNAASASRIRGTEVSTHVARGVFLLLYGRGKATTEPGGAPFRCLPQRAARRMQDVIAAVFPVRTQAFINAILLGDKYDLTTEDKISLSEAGLYHVTAVSGLHFAFLLSLLTVLVGRHRQRLLSAVSIPVLICYALVAGLTPSVVRACVMLILVLLAPLFGRENDPPTALGFALFLILLQNPCAVKSVSLQLSFAAMAGILLLTPWLLETVGARERGWFSRFVLGSLATTAGALVFTAPLTAAHFGSLVLVTALSNLLCLWAASLTFSFALLTVLIGFVSVPAATVAALAPHYGALYLLAAAKWLAAIPYHAVYFTGPTLRLWLVYVYAMLAACVLLRGRLRVPAAITLALATLALTLRINTQPFRDGALHMVALDVGQGQSVVLRDKGATALIDCGSTSYLDAGDVAADYLLSTGVRTLDYVLISHYHDDHCDGLATLLARLRADRLILPDIEPDDPLRIETLALAERYQIPVTFVREPLTFPLGDAILTVRPPLGEEDMNEACLTAVCSLGSFDALFTADIDTDTEALLLASCSLPDVEVMMAGHHGSRNATGSELLAAVKPETAIVSCGADNRYGHPNAEALRRLTVAGASIYRTDLQGNIHITVNTEE